MNSVIIVPLILTITGANAYHDPDLNYHLRQVQKTQNCGDTGYTYPAPTLQLNTGDVKFTAPPAVISQSITPIQYSSELTYQNLAPQISYASQPTIYQSSANTNTYFTPTYSTNEVHGYATSAGLSSISSNGRTNAPIATYAQAPIIAKVTAAPLIAKFSIAPVKTTYVSQNAIQQAQASYATGSSAKASLFSNTVQTGGPVVSQVFAAPAAGYATASSLTREQAAQIASNSYSSGIQYNQLQAVKPSVQIQPASQYANTALSHGSSSAASRYFTSAQYPSVNQYTIPIRSYTPAISHAAPIVSQYSVPQVTQYPAPQIAQYSTNHNTAPVTRYLSSATQHAGSEFPAYSAPSLSTYTVPAVSHYTAPVAPSATQYIRPSVNHVSITAPAHITTPGVATKTVHTDFLENYDAHPRYAFEYGVNDPHTGDIKQQKEQRDGEVVKGQYSLVEPDGSVRTVNYVADWETGFHADVRNSKDNQH